MKVKTEFIIVSNITLSSTLRARLAFIFFLIKEKNFWTTVFIRISAQPRISAHPTPTETQISSLPHPTLLYDVGHRGGSTREFTYSLEWQRDWNWNWISTNKRLSPKAEFSSVYFTETLLCYISFCYYHLLFCCKINILHLLKTVNIKVQKFNKRPGRRIESIR